MSFPESVSVTNDTLDSRHVPARHVRRAGTALDRPPTFSNPSCLQRRRIVEVPQLCHSLSHEASRAEFREQASHLLEGEACRPVSSTLHRRMSTPASVPTRRGKQSRRSSFDGGIRQTAKSDFVDGTFVLSLPVPVRRLNRNHP